MVFQPYVIHREYLYSQNPGANGQFLRYEAKNTFKALVGHLLIKQKPDKFDFLKKLLNQASSPTPTTM